MTATIKRPTGMAAFTIVWAGQLISVFASAMTQFGLTIWAYEKTGSATALGFISAAFVAPIILLSPFAGVLVDRHDRKLMMMVSDLTAITATAGVFALHYWGALQIWQLYVAAAVNGLGNAFQWPAYSAAISTMVPKEQYSRANGMMSLIESVPGVLAPILAGVLLPVVKLMGILIFDMATFLVAIASLALVRVPQPARTEAGQAGQGNIFQEAAYGFRYIFARRGLLGLLTFFICLNFVIGLSIPLIAPFILSRTGNDSATLGVVQSAAAIGSVIGGLLISLWGGFKRRMTSIFVGEALTGFFLLLVFGLGRSATVWVVAAVLGGIFPIFTNGASQAIWQAKVAPDVQGRVFSARRMIAWSVGPITPVLAGLLADYVTEPAMQSNSWLAHVFAPLVGASPGSGMAVQFIATGIVYVAVAFVTYLFFPVVRDLESRLPDHDQLAPAQTAE